jgi:hypothetical protein
MMNRYSVLLFGIVCAGCSVAPSLDANERGSMGRLDFGKLEPEAAEEPEKKQEVEYRLAPRSYSGGGPSASFRLVPKMSDTVATLEEDELGP